MTTAYVFLGKDSDRLVYPNGVEEFFVSAYERDYAIAGLVLSHPDIRIITRKSS